MRPSMTTVKPDVPYSLQERIEIPNGIDVDRSRAEGLRTAEVVLESRSLGDATTSAIHRQTVVYRPERIAARLASDLDEPSSLARAVGAAVAHLTTELAANDLSRGKSLPEDLYAARSRDWSR